MNNELFFSSRSDLWSTPQVLFDVLNEEFHFTLDPCADKSNHKCEKYYTKEQNGLNYVWSRERVFCNPPYGRKIKDWVEKSWCDVMYNDCDLVVMLIPARTDTKWFHKFIYNKPNVEVRFLEGRVKFGNCVNPAPFPSMIVIFRKVENDMM